MVQAGFVVSNSEVGLGSLRVEPLVFRLVCKNGLICKDLAQKKYLVAISTVSNIRRYDKLSIYHDTTHSLPSDLQDIYETLLEFYSKAELDSFQTS